MQLSQHFETYAAVPAVNWSSAYGEIAESHAANPRSLVGMTMGARKRAWLSNALYPVVFPSGIVTDETEMQAGYSWPEIRDDWPLLGERLRPCPGCCACWGHRISSARKWQETLADNCDGSGVMPARKEKP